MVYLSAIITILTEYPIEIVMVVTDPAHGLASKTDWLTPKAVRDACEALARERGLRAMQERMRAKQFAEREIEREPLEVRRAAVKRNLDALRALGFVFKGLP